MSILLALAMAEAAGSITINVANVRNARGRVVVDICPQERFLEDGCVHRADVPQDTEQPPRTYRVYASNDTPEAASECRTQFMAFRTRAPNSEVVLAPDRAPMDEKTLDEHFAALRGRQAARVPHQLHHLQPRDLPRDQRHIRRENRRDATCMQVRGSITGQNKRLGKTHGHRAHLLVCWPQFQSKLMNKC